MAIGCLPDVHSAICATPPTRFEKRRWQDGFIRRNLLHYYTMSHARGYFRGAAMLFEVLKKYEKYLIQALMALMAIVLVLGTLDLAWFVIKSVIESPYFLFDVNLLLDVFGMFMLVLIGIELLETIMKTYLTQGAPHYETVLSVAIIAIARKVIILDVKKVESLSLIGIAAIILALTVGYFMMKRVRHEKKQSGASLEN